LREGREINMSEFVHRFEHEPLYPIDTVTEYALEWADPPIDPLNQACQDWEDALESQRTRSREELTERGGGQNYLLLPDLVPQASPPNEYLDHYDLQHQAQDSLEALDG
jgi:hypothetical protein